MEFGYIVIIALYLTFGLKHTYSCPNLCSCYHKTVDCSNKGKTRIPVGIPPDTEILHLENNKITSLNADINKLQKLQELHLRGNKIEVLQEGDFQGLKNLKTVDFSHNLINEISTRAFKDMKAHPSCSGEECRINFSNNPIANIRKYAFFWTTGFSIFIGGTKNALKIESHAFYGNGIVPTFYVSDFHHLELGDSLFTDFHNISEIHFVGTNISNIIRYTFKGVQNLDSIQFTGSILHHIDSKAFSGMQFSEKSAGTDSTVESTGVIRFENCEISKLPEKAFADTNVKKIVFDESTIKKFEPFVFSGAPDLKSIHIEKCFLPNISSGVFSNLDKIKSIILLRNTPMPKENKVLQIGSNAFAESIHVNRITIGQSPSTTLHIKDHAFNDLSQVENIEIGNFHKIKMDPLSLQGLVDVKNFKIHNIEIPTLHNHSLSGMTRITNLHMQNVKVKSVQSARALTPVAQKEGVSKVVLDGVYLPCDCSVTKTFSQAETLFTNNNITCLYNETKIDKQFFIQTQDMCDPPLQRGSAPFLTFGLFFYYIVIYELFQLLFL